MGAPINRLLLNGGHQDELLLRVGPPAEGDG